MELNEIALRWQLTVNECVIEETEKPWRLGFVAETDSNF